MLTVFGILDGLEKGVLHERNLVVVELIWLCYLRGSGMLGVNDERYTGCEIIRESSIIRSAVMYVLGLAYGI